MSEEALLSSICADCDQDPPGHAYADWLEVSGQTSCASVVRAEIALNGAPENPALWERLHRARGAAPPRWLFRWEQPSLTRRVPLPLEEVHWVPTGLPWRQLPDLEEEAFSWAWLRELPDSARIYQQDVTPEDFLELAERVGELGFSMPEDMTSFFLDYLPQRRSIESAAYASFVIDPETWGPAPLLGGLFVPFYNDSQSTWGVGSWLHRSGAQAVLWFTPTLEGEQTTGEVIRFNEFMSAAGFQFAAPSFSSFVYRAGRQDQIWRRPRVWPNHG